MAQSAEFSSLCESIFNYITFCHTSSHNGSVWDCWIKRPEGLRRRIYEKVQVITFSLVTFRHRPNYSNPFPKTSFVTLHEWWKNANFERKSLQIKFIWLKLGNLFYGLSDPMILILYPSGYNMDKIFWGAPSYFRHISFNSGPWTIFQFPFPESDSENIFKPQF